MPVRRLIDSAAFDPEATKMLALVFGAAWDVRSTLAARDKDMMTREALAEQIVAVGRTGERNQQRLVMHALVYVPCYEIISRGADRLRAEDNGRR